MTHEKLSKRREEELMTKRKEAERGQADQNEGSPKETERNRSFRVNPPGPY